MWFRNIFCFDTFTFYEARKMKRIKHLLQPFHLSWHSNIQRFCLISGRHAVYHEHYRDQYYSWDDVFLCRNMSSREMDLGNTTNFWLTTSANLMEKWRTVEIHQIIYHVNYSSCELPQEINYVTLFVLLHKISSKLTHGFT